MEGKSKRIVIIIAVATVLAAAVAAGVILFTGGGRIEKKTDSSVIESARRVYSMIDDENYTLLSDEEKEKISEEYGYSTSFTDEDGNETVTDHVPFAKNGDCYFYEATEHSFMSVYDIKNRISYDDIGLVQGENIKYVSVITGKGSYEVGFLTDLDVIFSISLSSDRKGNGITSVYGNDGSLLFAQKENPNDGEDITYYNSDVKEISENEFYSLVDEFKAESNVNDLYLTNIG